MLIRGVFHKMHGLIFTIPLAISLCPGSLGILEPNCDTYSPKIEYDGRIGVLETFPWVGLLKVFLPDDDDGVKIFALAGLVLIHKEYAITHAHDVARIPMEEFQKRTILIFMVAPDRPWHFRAKTYHLHTEYQVLTVNTIALVQLDLTNVRDYPLKPICWNRRVSNATTDLYVIGFILENIQHEKVIYKTHMTDKGKCRQKYEMDGLNENKREPAHYRCGVSRRFNHSCTWNNGMVVVTNKTQHFNLVGLSVYGPGCASPARFIELEPYYDWVSEFIALKKPAPKSSNVPMHEIFVNDSVIKNARRGFGPLDVAYYDMYDINILGKNIMVSSKDASKLVVYNFQGELELLKQSCSGTKQKIYSDWVEIKGPKKEVQGSMTFKLSYYDIKSMPYGCFKIKDLKGNTNITLHYMEIMEMTAKDSEFETTPQELYEKFRQVPLYKGPQEFKIPYLAPILLSETNEPGRLKVKNYDIFFTIPFNDKFKMVLEIYNDKPIVNKTNQRRMNVDDNKLQPQAEKNNKLTESKKLLSNINAHNNKSRTIFGTYKYPSKPLKKVFTRTMKRPVKLFPQTSTLIQYNENFVVTRAPKSRSTPVYGSNFLDIVNKTVPPTRARKYYPYISFFNNAAPSIYLKTTYQIILIALLNPN